MDIIHYIRIKQRLADSSEFKKNSIQEHEIDINAVKSYRL
jgi:hypothetical protein